MTAGLLSRLCAFKALEKTVFKDLPLSFKGDDLSPEDRAFALAIAHKTLKYWQAHQSLIEKLTVKKRLDDAVLLLLHMAFTQIRLLDVPPYAAVNTTLNLAQRLKKIHSKGFLNGVLRTFLREQEAITLKDPSLPPWLMDALKKHYGQQTALRIAESFLSEPLTYLGVKKKPEHWATAFEGAVITDSIIVKPTKGRIENLEGYEEGAWWVQDLAASLPAMLLNPQKNERVLDMCAAPGGKTAQLCQSGASVTSLDISEERLKRLQENMARLGFHPKIIEADGTTFKSNEGFDAILLDAPCSGTGVLRRHPDIAFLRKPKDIEALQALQLALLKNAATLLKKGGRLVYSTCSLQKEEGEDVIDLFLKQHPNFKQNVIAPPAFLEETMQTPTGALRTLPFFMHNGMDGFFIALLEKVS